jgi:hypothetical protein
LDYGFLDFDSLSFVVPVWYVFQSQRAYLRSRPDLDNPLLSKVLTPQEHKFSAPLHYLPQSIIGTVCYVPTMASNSSDLKHHMQIIGTLEEYEFLTNFNPATLNLEQQDYVRKRLETIEVEAKIRSTLPYEVQREIYQHLLRDSEPLDITRRENHVTPEHYRDPHVEFDYWRLTSFLYPTDNVHDAVTSMNALEFVEDILLNPTHMARFQTLNPPKQITFEVLIRWDLLPDFLPEISLANMDSLFDLLHVFDGNVNRIKLKFLF